MKKHKKLLIILAIFLVALGIGIFAFRKITAPKNIFEEIQNAEYSRAKGHQKTVLSNNKYFKNQTATLKKDGNDYGISEKASKDSPFSLTTGKEFLGGREPFYTPFDNHNRNLYTDVRYVEKLDGAVLTIYYQYNSIDYLFSINKGLSISWEISRNVGKDVYTTSKSSILPKYGLTKAKLRKLETEKLELFLKQWFKSYPQSRFSMNNLGKYKTTYDNWGD